jgi:Helix-turn-helix domain of resolvase
MQQAVRDALIGFMAATAQAQAEATKAAQRAGIEHAKRGRCLSRPQAELHRDQLATVRGMLGQEVVGIAAIAKQTGLSRQTVYRIKDDPAGAEAALADVSAPTQRRGARATPISHRQAQRAVIHMRRALMAMSSIEPSTLSRHGSSAS